MVIDNKIDMAEIETNLTIFDYLLERTNKDNALVYSSI